MTTTKTTKTTVATTAASATSQRPRYSQMGRGTRCIAFLASSVLSTVLLGSVVIGMTAPAGQAVAASEQA